MIGGSLYTYTACGLYVTADLSPNEWQNCSYTAADALDGDWALTKIRERVLKEVPLNFQGPIPVDFALACLHVGQVERVQNLDWADMSVEAEEEERLHPCEAYYTVCGLYLETLQTCSYEFTARGPKMAYLQAWDRARTDGYTLLLAGVHHGSVPKVDGYPFADPDASEEMEMRLTIERWRALGARV